MHSQGLVARLRWVTVQVADEVDIVVSIADHSLQIHLDVWVIHKLAL
jgi:hypothetical protein